MMFIWSCHVKSGTDQMIFVVLSGSKNVQMINKYLFLERRNWKDLNCSSSCLLYNSTNKICMCDVSKAGKLFFYFVVFFSFLLVLLTLKIIPFWIDLHILSFILAPICLSLIRFYDCVLVVLLFFPSIFDFFGSFPSVCVFVCLVCRFVQLVKLDLEKQRNLHAAWKETFRTSVMERELAQSKWQIYSSPPLTQLVQSAWRLDNESPFNHSWPLRCPDCRNPLGAMFRWFVLSAQSATSVGMDNCSTLKINESGPSLTLNISSVRTNIKDINCK